MITLTEKLLLTAAEEVVSAWDGGDLSSTVRELSRICEEIRNGEPTIPLPQFTEDDWRAEVAAGDTVLGFAEWQEHHLEAARDDLFRPLPSGAISALEMAADWIIANRKNVTTGGGQQAHRILDTLNAAIAKAKGE
jgi:hypothetical protein